MTHCRRPTTRNAALREALGDWLDQHEQLAGLLDPESLRQQFRAAYNSQRPSPEGVPIHRRRRLLQWPREQTPPQHPFHQWELKLTGESWEKSPLGSPRFSL